MNPTLKLLRKIAAKLDTSLIDADIAGAQADLKSPTWMHAISSAAKGAAAGGAGGLLTDAVKGGSGSAAGYGALGGGAVGLLYGLLKRPQAAHTLRTMPKVKRQLVGMHRRGELG